MPKLYFYDTGLLSYLLGIKNPHELYNHHAIGALFENLIFSDLYKYKFNNNLSYSIYFWRDHKGEEIDCIIENGNAITCIEIKAGETKNQNYFNNIESWKKTTAQQSNDLFVVYGGDESLSYKQGKLVSWKELNSIFETLK